MERRKYKIILIKIGKNYVNWQGEKEYDFEQIECKIKILNPPCLVYWEFKINFKIFRLKLRRCCNIIYDFQARIILIGDVKLYSCRPYWPQKVVAPVYAMGISTLFQLWGDEEDHKLERVCHTCFCTGCTCDDEGMIRVYSSHLNLKKYEVNCLNDLQKPFSIFFLLKQIKNQNENRKEEKSNKKFWRRQKVQNILLFDMNSI